MGNKGSTRGAVVQRQGDKNVCILTPSHEDVWERKEKLCVQSCDRSCGLWTSVNTLMNLGVPYETGNFMTS